MRVVAWQGVGLSQALVMVSWVGLELACALFESQLGLSVGLVF